MAVAILACHALETAGNTGRVRVVVNYAGNGIGPFYHAYIYLFVIGVDGFGNLFFGNHEVGSVPGDFNGIGFATFDQNLGNARSKVFVAQAQWSESVTDQNFVGTAATAGIAFGETAGGLGGPPQHTYTILHNLQPFNVRQNQNDVVKGTYMATLFDQFLNPINGADGIEWPHAGSGLPLGSSNSPASWGDDNSSVTTNSDTPHNDLGGYSFSGKGLNNGWHVSVIQPPLPPIPNPEEPVAGVITPPAEAVVKGTTAFFTVSNVVDEDGQPYTGQLYYITDLGAANPSGGHQAVWISNGSGSFGIPQPNVGHSSVHVDFYEGDPPLAHYRTIAYATVEAYDLSVVPTQPFPASLIAGAMSPIGGAVPPVPAVAQYGQSVTVYAQVRDQYGAPMGGKPVTFTIHSSASVIPSGAAAVRSTDGNGIATYTFTQTGSLPREDVVLCDAGGSAKGFALVTWQAGVPEPPPLPPSQPTIILVDRANTLDHVKQAGQNVSVRARLLDQYGNPRSGYTLTATIRGNGTNPDTSLSSVTDASGYAYFTYTRSNAGLDLITVALPSVLTVPPSPTAQVWTTATPSPEAPPQPIAASPTAGAPVNKGSSAGVAT